VKGLGMGAAMDAKYLLCDGLSVLPDCNRLHKTANSIDLYALMAGSKDPPKEATSTTWIDDMYKEVCTYVRPHFRICKRFYHGRIYLAVDAGIQTPVNSKL
jgi:hypothetical protein